MTADRRSLGSGILTMWTTITIMSLTLCESSRMRGCSVSSGCRDVSHVRSVLG
jgi:hypothetical protein